MSDFSLSLRSDYKIVCWLMLLLASFYLFFFSGRFHSFDEIHSVALTETFLMEGSFHTNQIDLLGISPISGPISIQNKVWSILLSPLQQLAYWLAYFNPWPNVVNVGIVSVVLLSNWWITTITGGLLYLLVRRLGYQPATGVMVTLAWGVGTLAFVYSKLLFMQPMASLRLLVIIYLIMLSRPSQNDQDSDSSRTEPSRMIKMMIMGIVLGLLLLIEPHLLLYMPLLLPASWGILGWLYSSLERRWVGLFIIGLTIANFLLTNVWQETNDGIRDWVPLLPLWCLGLAPYWESHRTRLPLIFVIILSALIQLPNMLIDFNSSVIQASNQDAPFAHQLWRVTDEVYSLDYVSLLSNQQTWDVAWIATGNWYLGVAIFLLCVVAFYSLYQAIQAKNTVSIRIVSVCMLGLVGVTQTTAYDDPKWSAYHEELLPLVKHLNVAPANSVLFFEMHGYHDYADRVEAWFNLNHSRMPHTQLLQQTKLEKRLLTELESKLQQAQWIYLATEGTAPGNWFSGTERWFSQHAFLVRNEWVGPYTRLTVFYNALTASLQSAISIPQPFSDGITLLEAKTNTDANGQRTTLQPSDPLLVSLKWQATEVPETDYTVFVQLLGPYGVVAEQEGWPQANFSPTSSWQADEIIIDQRALIIPDVPAGEYSVIIGMFNSRTGQRLTIGNDETHTISLGVVRVN